ncbi:MAG: hypothetical protein ACRCYO_08470 [Bacteroidia bacterium]
MKQALSVILVVFFVLASSYDSLVYFTEKAFDQKFYVLEQIDSGEEANDSEEETGKEEKTSEKEFTNHSFFTSTLLSDVVYSQSWYSLFDYSIPCSSYSGEIFSPPESSLS